MAEPARHGLRPARRSGLTSPDPVRTRLGPRRPPEPPPPSQEPRTSRRTGERQDAHPRIHSGKPLVQKSNRKGPTGIGRWIEAEESTDRGHESCYCYVAVLAEKIYSLKRGERPPAAEVNIRHRGIIESNRDQPRYVRTSLPQLLDGQREFFVLVTPDARGAVGRETDDKDEGILHDRATDLHAPVLTWPQVTRIAPHGDSSSLKFPLQPVNVATVLADVADECMASRLHRNRQRFGAWPGWDHVDHIQTGKPSTSFTAL
jgi:hypothetical protein